LARELAGDSGRSDGGRSGC